MKKITTVLFDLDGTLLGMDQKGFLKLYFGALVKKFEPFGYEREAFLKGIFESVDAMIKNDSGKTNEEIFWQTFSKSMGEDMSKYSKVFEDFYNNEFIVAKSACEFREESNRVIKYLKNKGIKTVLATNPVFPSIATEHRMRWAGIDKNDFELYTTYENSTCCKPNTEYYAEILEKIGVKAEECLMVGNDVREDMVAEKLGLDVFLLTNDLINHDNKDISVYKRGSFDQLFSYFEEIL